METEPGDFEPNYAAGRDSAGDETSPIVRWKLGVLEDGIEKVEVNDPTNGQRLRDIEPQQSLHLPWALAVRSHFGQGSLSFRAVEESLTYLDRMRRSFRSEGNLCSRNAVHETELGQREGNSRRRCRLRAMLVTPARNRPRAVSVNRPQLHTLHL